MANWRGYGDVWVNLDQAETLTIARVEGETWELTAHMPSGRTIELLTGDEAMVRHYAALVAEKAKIPDLLWLWRWRLARKARERHERRSGAS